MTDPLTPEEQAALERLRLNSDTASLIVTIACERLAQENAALQDCIARAIDRLTPEAPNHDPHMLTAAVT